MIGKASAPIRHATQIGELLSAAIELAIQMPASGTLITNSAQIRRSRPMISIAGRERFDPLELTGLSMRASGRGRSRALQLGTRAVRARCWGWASSWTRCL